MKRGYDLTNCRFGSLVVQENTPQRDHGFYVWKCKCDCGEEILVDTRRLRRGTVTNCGCASCNSNKEIQVESKSERQLEEHNALEKNTAHKRRSLDLRGYEKGFIRVVEKTDIRDYKGSIKWRCKCLRCGNDVLLSADSIMHGNIVSCGCYRKETILERINTKLHLIDGTCVDWLNGNRSRPAGKSGVTGVYQSKSGSYFANIGFKGKRYYIGSFKSFEEACVARLKAEKLIHSAFVESYKLWAPKAALDPIWAEENPLIFEVEKINGEFVIRTS